MMFRHFAGQAPGAAVIHSRFCGAKSTRVLTETGESVAVSEEVSLEWKNMNMRLSLRLRIMEE